MTPDIQAMKQTRTDTPATDWRQRRSTRAMVFLLAWCVSGLGYAVEFPSLPLQTGVVQPAPNVIFILDDSTSMEDDVLDTGLSWSNTNPGLGNGSGAPYTKNPLSYNPAITYLPWASANATDTAVERLPNANFNAAYRSPEFATSGSTLDLRTGSTNGDYYTGSPATFYVPKPGLTDDQKTPFIIGIAGSVAVGKSTTARVLKELLQRWPSSPKVDLVTTDGFLYPNEVLRKNGIMDRKGFPESYDIGAILRFLSAIKAGMPNVKAPLYSHLTYDVLPGQYVTIDRPDILIFEGINVLQTGNLPADGIAVPFVSDFFDFAIYIDAPVELIHDWYVERFMRLRETAFRDPQSFFHRYSKLSEHAARAIAEQLWENINLKNLKENILPTRPRADLILRKGANHLVERVALRKL